MRSEKDINSIIEFLAYYSARTWIELKKVHQGHFKIYETTITQNLIKDFVIHSEYLELPIYIFESRNEKANGNDLEIFVETVNGFLFIPTQAKVIKGTKYPTISHNAGGKPQIEMLIDYARKLRGIPAYLFYNYFGDFTFQEYTDSILPGYEDLHFGCTIGSAFAIYNDFYYKSGRRKWNIPTFNDLHLPMNYAFPIFYAFWRLIIGNIQDISWFVNGKDGLIQNIKFYKFKELDNNENWKPFWKPERISGISDSLQQMGDPFETELNKLPEIISHVSTPEVFAPMYRIIICRERKHRVYNIN